MGCKFIKGDYIINRDCGDMAIFDKLDKKNYMHFKYYYGHMFDTFKDVKKYTLQLNYQSFYDICTEEEKKSMDEKISELKKG